MEEQVTQVMLRIFNSWTGLKMAVDHSMAGPDSKKVALDFVNYMVPFCLYTHDVDQEQIQSALEEILDEEFQTVCEDDSPRQIGEVLWRLLGLLREGKIDEYQREVDKLPVASSDWLKTAHMPVQQRSPGTSGDADSKSSQAEPMDDDGWVQVTKRKPR